MKDYFEDKSLSELQLQRLMNLQRRLDRKSYRWVLPALAGFCAACIGFVVFFNLNSISIEQQIANEVIYNHKKNMPSEIISNDYAAINQGLQHLDFSVEPPNKNLPAGMQVAGARYCSVLGKIAAQLRIKVDESTQDATLYQFKSSQKLNLREGITITNDGVRVKMWQQDDLTFVLAESL